MSHITSHIKFPNWDRLQDISFGESFHYFRVIFLFTQSFRLFLFTLAMSNDAQPNDAKSNDAEHLAIALSSQISSVVDFWFQGDPNHLHSKLWFHATPSQDAQMHDQFLAVRTLSCSSHMNMSHSSPPLTQSHTHLSTTPNALSTWLSLPKGPIAAIILLDQLPRNMFRGTPAMFATDVLALPIAKSIISSAQDKTMTPHERLFVYMCLQHSEVLDDAKRAEELLKGLAGEREGKTYNGILKSARGHVEMLESVFFPPLSHQHLSPPHRIRPLLPPQRPPQQTQHTLRTPLPLHPRHYPLDPLRPAPLPTHTPHPQPPPHPRPPRVPPKRPHHLPRPQKAHHRSSSLPSPIPLCRVFTIIRGRLQPRRHRRRRCDA